MTEKKVAWSQITLATGRVHQASKEPYVVSYKKGDLVDRDEHDSDAWREKFDRLVEAKALVDVDEAVDRSQYQSAFDVPLTGGPGESEVRLVVDEENDDLGDDDEEDGEEPTDSVTPDSVPDDQPTDEPARPSVNASGAVWHQYAETVGVEVAPDAKRADVIQAVEAAGK
jgi:hypothetical protein